MYEITIRVRSSDLATRVVTQLVRSDCYGDVEAVRVALVGGNDPEPDLRPADAPPLDDCLDDEEQRYERPA